MYHDPVLLRESIEGLNLKKGGTYVDITYGGGGHSREILKNLHDGSLIAFDQDQDALANKLDDAPTDINPSEFQVYEKLPETLQSPAR